MSVLQQIPIGEILDLLGNSVESQIAFVGADFRYRYANDAYQAWLTRPGPVLRGKSMSEVLSRTDLALLKPYAEAALRGEPSEFEMERRHPAHGLRIVVGRIEPGIQPDGEIFGFLEIFRDVTEERARQRVDAQRRVAQARSELALLSSEKRFRTMIEQSPHSDQILDQAGRCIHFNESWRRLWLSTGEELQNYNILEDQQLADLGLIPLIKRAFEGETVEIAAFEYDPAKSGFKGRPRWVSALIYPILDEEGEQETVLVLQDVTEERQAQIELQATKERLQLIVETALDAVITIDADHLITGWDGQAEQIFGWNRKEVVGKNLFEAIIPDPARLTQTRALARYLKGGGRPALNRRFELEVQHKDGHAFPCEMALTSARQDGRPFFTVFARDISDRVHSRKEMEKLTAQLEARVTERTEELRNTYRELEEAYHKLETFTYSVAHDLRNPLRRLAAIATIMEEDAKVGKLSGEEIALIRRFVKDMTRLIEDHLDFARYGHAELHRTSIDLSSVAWKVARDIQTRYPGVDIRVRVLPNLKALADPLMLNVIFENLIENGAEFSHKVAKPTVEVGTTTSQGERTFYVKDNGVGFDPQFAHKVFEPFERLHRDEDFPGSGIGLFNTRELVQRHGGAIWCQTIEGSGSTFFFTLGPSTPERRPKT